MLIDLSQPFSEDMSYVGTLPTPKFETVKEIEKDGVNVQRYCVPTHIGTHVDAPKHFVEGGKSIDDLSLSRFTGEGVILDVSKNFPTEIGIEDVKNSSGSINSDDIVLLYSGWEDKHGTKKYEPHPWISEELADWFVDSNVKMVAIDWLTPDIPESHRPAGWHDFPVHRKLLGNGVLIAENLTNLSGYTGIRLNVSAFPVKISGGDGAPIRFVGCV